MNQNTNHFINNSSNTASNSGDYNLYRSTPSEQPEKKTSPIIEIPASQDIIPDEVPRRDGPGGESGK